MWGEAERVPEAERLWGDCVGVLRDRLPESTWKAWLEPARPLALDDHRLLLGVSSRVARERVESRLDVLEAVIAEVAGRPYAVEVEVRDELEEGSGAQHRVAAGVGASSGKGPGNEEALVDLPRDDYWAVAMAPPAPGADNRNERARSDTSVGAPALADIGLNPAYTFENFVIGSSNRFSHAAALSVAETPAKSYNPLFIYGDAGLGKTHLLHAIGHYVRQNYPAHVVRYVSTEAFLNHFIDAIRTNTTPALKQRYRQCDVLLVDDVQLIEGKERFQEEFFHTIDHLHSAGRQVVISSDRPPKAMSTLEERLRSRFSWGLITDLLPPDLETRLAILQKKAAAEPTPVADDVMNYIATSITNNIRELEGALHKVLAYTSLNREPLTLALAERLLNDIISEPRPVTPKVILDVTAEMFGLSVEDLRSKSRSRPLVTARQIGMYAFRQMTDFSYPAIGREFGDRDHTTVIHAVEKISTLMKERPLIYDQVNELMQRIRSGA